jgi:phospholipid/cholesterol/gamma-HCH transport system permease protein
MLASIAKAQKVFENSCEGAGYTIDLLIKAFFQMGRVAKKRRELLDQLSLCMLGSIGVVFIIAFFTGMIVSLQTGLELRKYGQEQSLGYIVAVGMCREMGPVFTCLTLAGLVGSTYAAEIGTMKVSEEVDALEVMSIDPIYYLVMPRVIALGVAAVALTVYADLIGILGGSLVAKSSFGVDIVVFLKNAQDILKLRDIYGGLGKSLVFGVSIAAVSCSQGLRAGHGAAGVGKATLRAVVVSFIVLLVFDYLLSWMLQYER